MKNKFRKKSSMLEKNKKSEYVLIAIQWIIAIVIIYCAGYIICDMYPRILAESQINEMRKQKQLAVENSTSVEEDSNVKIKNQSQNQSETQIHNLDTNTQKDILNDYMNIYQENDDMYGWIKIDNTKIDFPVMYTPDDPDFYGNKNIKKQVCKSGGYWIWIRDNPENCDNMFIYGHHMHYGMMFSSLGKYKKKDFYEKHKYIQFDTLYEKATYEIISVVITQDYGDDDNYYQFYNHIAFANEEEFQEYIDNAKLNSCYDIEATAEYGTPLITLSTCDYSRENGRLLIIAKKN